MLVFRSGFVKFCCMKTIRGLAHGPEECLLAELRYISGGRVSTGKRKTTSEKL
jgi:hypothetical protein